MTIQHDGLGTTGARQPTGTAGAAFLCLLLDAAQSLGVARAELVAAAGLDAAAPWLAAGAVPAASARVPLASVLGVCAALPPRLGDAALGVAVAARVRPASFSVLGYALMTCSTLGEALAVIPHYRRLMFDADYGETELARSGAQLTLAWRVRASASWPYSPPLAEALLASWVGFGRWVAAADLPLSAVEFAHASPGRGAEAQYRRFFACPVRFGCAHSRLVFAADVLERPLPQADAALHAAMREQAQEALLRLRGEQAAPVVAATRNTLVALMPRCETSLGQVAARLGVSGRSLQRQLAAHGHSFQGLLDAARRELAGVYLRDPGVSVLDVALLLGYAEHSSFTRAFRGWFGCAPSEWRLLARAAPPRPAQKWPARGGAALDCP